ncbi:hypothetical protein J2755_000534 [Methanohalophilus levihalophilus]|uniref:hypothetical protein n=1 Tax=Methanohalophilus levihalophilus TaxID=1431282 RepID=UPI001AE730A7|nr:hypothetical protein [Methanohalophilus levihalophilus]MBP2029614.1 hypothetical protein [Methanohalophilus levihalophilus]
MKPMRKTKAMDFLIKTLVSIALIAAFYNAYLELFKDDFSPFLLYITLMFVLMASFAQKIRKAKLKQVQ